MKGSVLDCTGPPGLSKSAWQACHCLERELPLNDLRAVPIQRGTERIAECAQWLWLERELPLRAEKID